jgi:hypothetical protein
VTDSVENGFADFRHELSLYWANGLRYAGPPFKMLRRRHVPVIITAFFILSGVALFGPRDPAAADNLPKQLSDRAFWKLVTDFSEPDGFFRSDNFISNETTFQEVIPDLKKRVSPNGVYLGVGPDQNFTYIAALHPRMAFIIDIRRQNMLEHLMYKAIIEMSEDRADFLSRLFSRPRPGGLTRTTSAAQMFDAYNRAPSSEKLFAKNLQDVLDRLVKRHGFTLSIDDRRSIDYIYRAFYSEGPDLRYSFPRQQVGARWFPNYMELMTTTDLGGQNHSYVASEANYRVLREFQRNNLLVPIVGDFGGDKAIQSVGRYLREHGATANFFYTSNVEQYLFQTDAWQRYYRNVETLPIDNNSTFIRAFFNMGFRFPPGIITPDLHSVQLLDPVRGLLNAFRAGELQTYDDVVARTKY